MSAPYAFECYYNYVTVCVKTDHLAQVSDFKILVPRCSAYSLYATEKSESRQHIRSRVTRVQVRAPEKCFYNRNKANFVKGEF